MNTEIYQFQLGDFACAIVNDGTFAYPQPIQFLFAGAPQERVLQALQAHNLDPDTWTEYVSSYPSLLVNTGKHRVLVDTGAGRFAPTTGRLLANLQTLGITPDQIDTVILTHGHPDHIGGSLDSAGEPTFRNARYVMGSEEWNFWAADPDPSSLKLDPRLAVIVCEVARKTLPALRECLDLVEDGDEIVPGIQATAAPGHTAGHMALTITSQGDQLLCGADAVPHPIHVEQPDWIGLGEYDSDIAVVTRRKLLGQAAVEKMLVHMFHFPFPGLGYVVLHNSGWCWRPYHPS
jgi:glyoxylase-like metal-dependent hydrolase (beta-lactamase superfamily II)